MRKMFKFVFYLVWISLTVIIVLFFLSMAAYRLNRYYKIKTIREFVIQIESPNSKSILTIYQRGGNSIVHLLTPLEFECSNEFGITSFTEEIKMGHIYRNSESNKPDVFWEDDMSGSVEFGSYPSVDFSCKTE